jgi:hypothetical protein
VVLSATAVAVATCCHDTARERTNVRKSTENNINPGVCSEGASLLPKMACVPCADAPAQSPSPTGRSITDLQLPIEQG